MERVFSVELGPSGSMNFGSSYGKGVPQSYPAAGMVETILGPGRYMIVLENGARLQVQGPNSLRIGDKVRVQSLRFPERAGLPIRDQEAAPAEGGFEWSAFIPLGFGGRGAKASLKVYVEERDGKRSSAKRSRAVYFIFTVSTESQGEIQWSIYLRGKEVSLQLYRSGKSALDDGIKGIIKTVEKALTDKGFILMAPVAFLKQPFKVPEGFRLNVRG